MLTNITNTYTTVDNANIANIVDNFNNTLKNGTILHTVIEQKNTDDTDDNQTILNINLPLLTCDYINSTKLKCLSYGVDSSSGPSVIIFFSHNDIYNVYPNTSQKKCYGKLFINPITIHTTRECKKKVDSLSVECKIYETLHAITETMGAKPYKQYLINMIGVCKTLTINDMTMLLLNTPYHQLINEGRREFNTIMNKLTCIDNNTNPNNPNDVQNNLNTKTFTLLLTDTFDDMISFDYLRSQIQRNTRFDNRNLNGLFAKIALGLHYLHSVGIYHNDLHKGNIIVTANDDIHRHLLDPITGRMYLHNSIYCPKIFDYDHSILFDMKTPVQLNHSPITSPLNDVLQLLENTFEFFKITNRTTEEMDLRKTFVNTCFTFPNHDMKNKFLASKFIRGIFMDIELARYFTRDEIQILHYSCNINVRAYWEALNLQELTLKSGP